MAIKQQGRLNFPGLNNYTIKGSGLELWQQYLENSVAELVGSRQSIGIIYGGEVTVVAALTVKVAKGLALFSNGIMVSWDDQNVVLTAADGVNPRYDRIELGYFLVNGTADVNNDNDPVVLDKLHVATAAALAGTPAGGPVAPVRTAEKISLALIHVAANQAILLGDDIDQTEDTALDLSYALLGTSPHGVRFNSRLGVLQTTTNGVAWQSVSSGVPKVITYAESPYTVTAAEPVLEVDTSGGAVTVNLPALADGFPIEITKITDDANAVTVTPNGADTINDDASDSLDQKYANKAYKPLSIGWVIR